MKSSYQTRFIHEFINFIVPRGKKSLFLSNYNNNSAIYDTKKYDYVILINSLEKEKDILNLLKTLHKRLSKDGRLIVIYRNYFYSFILGLTRSFIRNNKIYNNWLSSTDIKTFLYLTGFETITHEPLCFTTVNIPLLTGFVNRLVLHIFPFDHLSFLHYVVAKKTDIKNDDVSVSIAVPARNEEGNIRHIFEKMPMLGKSTEVIFIEGHSKDHTRDQIKKFLLKYKNNKHLKFYLYTQKGIGKADAVRLGFSHAIGDIFMIFDADLTIKPEELVNFYNAIASGKGDFVNGSRLVYPIEESAMQFFNILGNKFFSILYSWIIGQPIKDTLCGSKVLWRKDYIALQKDMALMNYYDPFGDFHLLLGAWKQNLKIIDIPIRYYSRTYGSTNIHRFKNAWELFKLSFHAIIKYKMRL